jgi:hypothetical protein
VTATLEQLAPFSMQMEISQLPFGRWQVTVQANYFGEMKRTFDSYLAASVWLARQLGELRPHVALAAGLAGKEAATQK